MQGSRSRVGGGDRHIPFKEEEEKSLESREWEPRGLGQAGEMAHSSSRSLRNDGKPGRGFRLGSDVFRVAISFCSVFSLKHLWLEFLMFPTDSWVFTLAPWLPGSLRGCKTFRKRLPQRRKQVTGVCP